MTDYAARIAAARAIGKGEDLLETVAPEIVATVPEGFDWKARGAVAGLVHDFLCGDLPRPLVKQGPVGEQVTTHYGKGHESLTGRVKTLLGKRDESEKVTDWLRLVRQAAENAANKGGFLSSDIIAAVESALTGGESEQAA